MKKSLFVLFLCLTQVMVFAQQTTNTEWFSFKRGSFSNQYYIGSQQVSYDDFMAILSATNEQSAKMFKAGRSLSSVGTVMSTVGAFFVGYDLGGRLAGGEGNTAMLAGGGCVAVGGIIMALVGEGKIKKALTLVQNNKQTSSIEFTFSQYGLGLCFAF